MVSRSSMNQRATTFDGHLAAPGAPAHPYDSSRRRSRDVCQRDRRVHTVRSTSRTVRDRPTGRMLFVKIAARRVPRRGGGATRRAGDPWRPDTKTTQVSHAPSGPPIVAGVVPPDVDTDRSVALPPGQYYVVIDNSPYVGQAAPPAPLPDPLFEPVARVSYLVSMGDAP